MQREKAEAVIVYAVVGDALSPDFPLGVELEVFVQREDAERFIEEVRADDPELASYLRIELGSAVLCSLPLRRHGMVTWLVGCRLRLRWLLSG